MIKFTLLLAASLLAIAHPLCAQDMPADYAGVLKTLNRQGDYKDNVLKVNIPRNDLKVSIDGIATPTPFGFGGWIAMTKGAGGHEVMMGDGIARGRSEPCHVGSAGQRSRGHGAA